MAGAGCGLQPMAISPMVISAPVASTSECCAPRPTEVDAVGAVGARSSVHREPARLRGPQPRHILPHIQHITTRFTTHF